MITMIATVLHLADIFPESVVVVSSICQLSPETGPLDFRPNWSTVGKAHGKLLGIKQKTDRVD
jgi:hypothetical protein